MKTKIQLAEEYATTKTIGGVRRSESNYDAFLAGFEACEKMYREKKPPRPIMPTKSMASSDKSLIDLLYKYIEEINDDMAGHMCGYCWDKMYLEGYPTKRDEQITRIQELEAEITRLKDKYESKFLGRP